MLVFKLALSTPLVFAGCPELYPFAFNDGNSCCFTGYDADNVAFADQFFSSETCNKNNRIECNDVEGCTDNADGIAINTKDWADDPTNLQCGGECDEGLHCCLYKNATNSDGVVLENYWVCAVPAEEPVGPVDPGNPVIVRSSSRLSIRDRNIIIGCIVGALALLALILLLWWCCCRKKKVVTHSPIIVAKPPPPESSSSSSSSSTSSSSSSSASSIVVIEPPPKKDVIILLDSSDSFNNKVMMNSGEYSKNWDETTIWTKDVVSALANKETEYAVTIIQFSGEKKLEASYIPGSLGASGTVSKSTTSENYRDFRQENTAFEPDQRSRGYRSFQS